MQTHHGCVVLRGAERRLAPEGGRFGRLFPKLSPCNVPSQFLEQLGAKSGPMDEGAPGSVGEARLPAGFVFLGQFIDHDITLDVTSSLDAAQDPEATHNFRTPALDLDCVYGGGPEASPHLYVEEKMLLSGPGGGGLPDDSDVPRNSAHAALIGDPRNDENRIISQLQLAFLKFHNAVVDHLHTDDSNLTGKELFEHARRVVRWHYQWMVIYDFLPRICGRARLGRILGGQRKAAFYPRRSFMPVEFSVAAYRYGHSQVPGELATNETSGTLGLFSEEFGMGFKPVNGPEDVVDWRLLFKVGSNRPQRARKIDVRLASTLLELPEDIVGEEAGVDVSLAVRNLKRGQIFGLPSGQAVAKAMRIAPLSEDELWPDSIPADLRSSFLGRAPLWYYILKEAEVERDGEKLGKLGAHIVAEVILGLIERDATSFLGVEPNWRPFLPRAAGRPVGDFDMEDLLAFAGLT